MNHNENSCLENDSSDGATPNGDGTQTVGRAIAILRMVASAPYPGLRLKHLIQMSGFGKSTTYRLLQRLVAEGMLLRDPQSKNYKLGSLVYELGLAALPASKLRNLCETELRNLAAETADTAFLVARSGVDSVCLDRWEGSFPIKTLTQGIGDRHPLGVGAGGLAILASMQDHEISGICKANMSRLSRYGLTLALLQSDIEQARSVGYSANFGRASSGVAAVGIALHSKPNIVVGSFFIATVLDRMTEDRVRYVVKILMKAKNKLEPILAVEFTS